MTFRWLHKRKAVGFVVGERWLTSAWLVIDNKTRSSRGNKANSILGARQSIQVVMLCQRPIHTHNSMSLAQLISSNLGHNILKRKPNLLIKHPFISLQLPEKLYRVIIIKRPKAVKLTGPWAAAYLADAGYNLNEWCWDLHISSNNCQFLLIKTVDLHEHLQPLQEQGCHPHVISFIDPSALPCADIKTDNKHSLHYQGMTVLPDPIAAQQAVCLALQSFGVNYA